MIVMHLLGKYTRVEVIDHSEGGVGRIMIINKHQKKLVRVESSEQDSGLTLKIFVSEEERK